MTRPTATDSERRAPRMYRPDRSLVDPNPKTIDELNGDVPLGDRHNSAFAGTLVTSGTAAGIVIATGDNTQIGRIAGMLQDVEGVDTPLIRRLASFSKVITVVIILFCVFVFVLGVLTGQPVAQMLMAAVALAVSAKRSS